MTVLRRERDGRSLQGQGPDAGADATRPAGRTSVIVACCTRLWRLPFDAFALTTALSPRRANDGRRRRTQNVNAIEFRM